MGECAELELERMEFHALMKEDPYLNWFIKGVKPTPKKIIWVTKDNRRIDIRDMTTQHIINSIAKCKRDKWRLSAIPYLEAELASRNNLKG